MKKNRICVVVAFVSLMAGLSVAAETNILSFSYSTSLSADASTPDLWLRKLNDGYWTNSVTDGVKYGGDVIVTVDLSRRTRVNKVDVYTFTAGGGSPLSTQGVTLEGSNDNALWGTLGTLSAVSNGLFSYSVPIYNVSIANVRYLRLTCTKGAGAAGQSLAEIVVSGTSASASGLVAYTYATSMPYHSDHADPSLAKLYDGLWTNASTQSVQYGPHFAADVNPLNPTNCIASNVVVVTTFSSVRTIRSASLFAFRSPGAGGYGTWRVTASNSLDGVTWSCAGVQTNCESSFPGYYTPNSIRFDFTLPNVDARYLAFACEKVVNNTIVRQLLGEIQINETVSKPAAWGAPLAFTYELSKTPSSSVDSSQCPKLTDGVWDSNTRNAVRVYGYVEITADLGAPRYVAGTDLICWSNKFSLEAGYYGTGRVVVNSSLDKTNWTPVADITSWSPVWPYHHAVTFTNMPYARYMRFDANLCEDLSPAITNTAHIFGELAIYQPQSAVVGALPVEMTNAIPSAGFEAEQIPDGDSASMLVKGGGATNGWTFSYTDAANYAGFQRNNSTLSTTNNASGSDYLRYFTKEGAQTAVLMGSGNMATQISVPTNGTYALQLQVNSTVVSGTSENGGYDFRVRLDGADKGIVAVLQLTNTVRQILLADVSAGAHALRLEGVNSKSVTWGALIDNLKLKRYEVAAEQVVAPGRGFVFMADSTMPLALDYAGTLLIKELWLDGALMPPSRYSALNFPAIFDGPGALRYDRGTLFQVR